MKTITKIFSVLSIGLLLTSCEVQTDVYDDGYGVYRAPDGGTYRRGVVYRDRNGYSYKNGQIIIINQDGHYKKLPPGQAKKIYGGKAKDYAPGQVKKKGYYYDNDYRYNDKKHKKNKKYKYHDD